MENIPSLCLCFFDSHVMAIRNNMATLTQRWVTVYTHKRTHTIYKIIYIYIYLSVCVYMYVYISLYFVLVCWQSCQLGFRVVLCWVVVYIKVHFHSAHTEERLTHACVCVRVSEFRCGMCEGNAKWKQKQKWKLPPLLPLPSQRKLKLNSNCGCWAADVSAEAVSVAVAVAVAVAALFNIFVYFSAVAVSLCSLHLYLYLRVLGHLGTSSSTSLL